MRKAFEKYLIDQNWAAYGPAEHGVWQRLFERQAALLKGRVAPVFLDGLKRLDIMAGGIPDFRRLNDALDKATGWRIVAVPGLVPDEIFYGLLANRIFPSTCFIRTPAQMDYLEEPDVFHDVFGHVPLLVDPVFADYMQAFGKGGVRAGRRDMLPHLARLYWYTVEFGLMATPEGHRIYGAGIVSSKGESIFSVESPSPNRVGFDLERVMRTRYRIDDFQQTYFVIENFRQLFDLAEQEFAPLYERLAGLEDIAPGVLLPGDEILTRGTGAYHADNCAA